MTRKRCVKLLMSYEIQRNQAQHIAGTVSEFGTYDKLYTARLISLEFGAIGITAKRAARAFVRLASLARA